MDKMRGKIKYQKELQNTYMIAAECKKEIIESFCGQMVLRNKIRGLATCEMHLIDGQREIWYDITSLQTLEQAFAVKELSCGDLKTLLWQIIQIIEETEKYLVDGRQLCFEAEYLYFNMETNQIWVLFDFTEEMSESSIRRLAEFILERINHEEEQAVELAYFFYECAGKESFCVKEIEACLEEKSERQDRKKDNPIMPEKPAEKENEIGEWAEQNNRKEQAEKIQGKSAAPGQAFLWNSRNGMLAEAGLVCVIMALLSTVGYFIVRQYFFLTGREELLWVAAAVLLFVTGVSLSVFGFVKERKEEKTDRDAVCTLSEKKLPEAEAELWQWKLEGETGQQWMGEAEAECPDGKTIYVGKALLSREYRLVEIKKGNEKEYPITSWPFLMGKDKERVNLFIKDHSVSRIHARLMEEEGNIYIEDLHSTNGTYLNDLALSPHDRIKIKRGDVIQLGRAEFVLR